jgi:hypothetical protein
MRILILLDLQAPRHRAKNQALAVDVLSHLRFLPLGSTNFQQANRLIPMDSAKVRLSLLISLMFLFSIF